jgi:hypothetical protein
MFIEETKSKELKSFLIKIHDDILAGIKHGFFTCEIECDVVQGKKRQVTYKAGKSYKITIPEEELKNL